MLQCENLRTAAFDILLIAFLVHYFFGLLSIAFFGRYCFLFFFFLNYIYLLVLQRLNT